LTLAKPVRASGSLQAVTATRLAVAFAFLAGLAGAAQAAIAGALGRRVGSVQAAAFGTVLAAAILVLLAVVLGRGGGIVAAIHEPPWLWLIGVLGATIVLTITFAPPLIGTFATVALLIAGQFVSSDLERAVRPLLSAPGIVRLPYLEEREFWLAASAVDACLNLRYPATGETSGISIRLMGIGKPILMTDSEECSHFPEDACVRIAPGLAERESLLAHMILVTSMTRVAETVGLRGAEHIQQHHRVEAVSSRYWEVLCEFRT